MELVSDIVLLVVIVVFLAASVGFVNLCERV